MPKTLVLVPEVQAILAQCALTEDRVYLPQQQLPRPLYVAVDQALRAAGGKWNKHLQCHVFDRDPRQTLQPYLATGTVPRIQQELQSFYTPPAVAEQLLGLAALAPDDFVLEPSAGMGALALAAATIVPQAHIFCVDIDDLACTVLKNAGFAFTYHENFLTWRVEQRFDVVLMNPPFANGADMAHIQHAHTFLRPGGRLISVIPAMTGKKSRKNTEKAFNAFLEQHLQQRIELPVASFSVAGTKVAVSILVLGKED